MSLLAVKTKNLTWQDHQLNFEMMLAPTFPKLLLNKHRTYSTKCDQAKSQIEQQRATYCRSFTGERRLVERQSISLNKRQANIRRYITLDMQRTQSAKRPAQPRIRSHSAPTPDTFRKAVTSEQVRSSPKIFLKTKSTSTSLDRLMSSGMKSSTRKAKFPNVSITLDSVDEQPEGDEDLGADETTTDITVVKDSSIDAVNKSDIKTTYSTDFVFKRTKINYDEEVSKDDQIKGEHIAKFVSFYHTEDQQKRLQANIVEFMRKLKTFNENPSVTGKDLDEFVYISKSRPTYKEPMVAAKVTMLKLETNKIEKAFDAFRNSGANIESFDQLVRISTKIKARMHQAQNTSLVPTMAAYKSSRTFLRLIKHKSQYATDDVASKI